jgi:hypothetical protein
VFGDDAAEAAMTQAVLPWACLAPAAVLRRLFADAALHRSQVQTKGSAEPLAGLQQLALANTMSPVYRVTFAIGGHTCACTYGCLQAPLVMAVLQQLQPAAAMQQPGCALPLGVICLRDALAASAHHLRSEAAAPGFLAMAAASAGGSAPAFRGAAGHLICMVQGLRFAHKEPAAAAAAVRCVPS